MPRILASFCLLALLLTACASSAPVSPTPDPASAPADQPQAGSHTPVILRVVEREEIIHGYSWHSQEIYFMDPDGDAAAMTYAITSSSLSYAVTIPDEPLEASSGDQKTEALFTVAAKCRQKLELAFESRIRDQAGNLSEPVLFTLSCAAPQPLDTTPFLISGLITTLSIALVLLVGFWLLFRRHPAERLPALRSTILMFFLFMLLIFFQGILHEGGHSLYPLVRGVPITLFVHPFMFAGYARPLIDSSIWKDILGSATAIPVGLIISLIFWKRRSSNLLPWVMLFSYIALLDGFNVMGIMGDFRNLVMTNGLPAIPFLFLGALIFCIGILSFFSLLPLAGLDPRDKKALFVLPAAIFLIYILSSLVAYLFVPGSPIDLEYFLGQEILLSVKTAGMFWLGIGVFLAVLYVTLFRKLYPRLPSWLHTETVNLTWKDLRIPGILWTVSVVIGLIVIL